MVFRHIFRPDTLLLPLFNTFKSHLDVRDEAPYTYQLCLSQAIRKAN